ncbi:MAG TPA: folylpolyglutamate synthase/dihydrofolate synthase family protein [Pyrinomonadaceae bacterium]
MNFAESLSYLLSLGNEVLAMKLGLASTEKLLAALGNPQNNFLKIQVAGTNGKGSTCAFLDSICLGANIKTGLYTSPHLVSITERIKLGGEEIGEEDFARHATRVREISENLVAKGELETVPTFFEQVTAIAVSAFAEAKIELAILETGLGGRFDSVTATRAEIAALTPIDYDHEKILGGTLSEIASEKAAIIRERMKIVVSPQKAEAMRVILERCVEARVSPLLNGCEYFPDDCGEVGFKTPNEIYPRVRIGLEGEHQYENACLAINLAEILSMDFGFSISGGEIYEGLGKARHKGRLEWWNHTRRNILFDGAHNIAGARALRNYLQKYCPESKIAFVFGAMRDKNLSAIAEILFPLAEDLILTEPDNARCEKVEELEKYAERVIDKSKIFLVPDVFDAVDSAIRIALKYPAESNSFVCVTGSLYLVGEAQKALTESVL